MFEIFYRNSLQYTGYVEIIGFGITEEIGQCRPYFHSLFVYIRHTFGFCPVCFYVFSTAILRVGVCKTSSIQMGGKRDGRQ